MDEQTAAELSARRAMPCPICEGPTVEYDHHGETLRACVGKCEWTVVLSDP